MKAKKTILLLTDFSYQAKGREYYREDVELSGFLRKYFKVGISHIDDIQGFLGSVDACRSQDGKLLLMELEDYNPFLSLDLLQSNVKEQFLEALCISLSDVLRVR